MTLREPIWLQSLEYSASDDRLPLFGSTIELPGVSQYSHMRVYPNTGLSLNISEGHAIIAGNAVSGQGWYAVSNVGLGSVTIQPGSSKTRVDLVILRVRDAQVSGANSDAIFDVVQGTPSSSPQQPAVPSMSIVLAAVTVPAGANSISAANINNGQKWRAMFHREMGSSVMPVPSRSVANLQASRMPISPSQPFVVWRNDATAGNELEVTTDGKTWRTVAPAVGNGAIVPETGFGIYSRGANQWSSVGNLTTISINLKRTAGNRKLKRWELVYLTKPLPSNKLPVGNSKILGPISTSQGFIECGISNGRFFLRHNAGSWTLNKDTWIIGYFTYQTS